MAVASAVLQTEDEFVQIISTPVTAEKVSLFAEATGDYNPIHFDTEAAQKVGLEGPAAHGGLVLGFVSTAILSRFGKGVMPRKAAEMKFLNPAYVGDVVAVYIHITKERGGMKFVDVEVRSNRNTILTMHNMCVLVP